VSSVLHICHLNSACSDVDGKGRTSRASELFIFRLFLLTNGLKQWMWYIASCGAAQSFKLPVFGIQLLYIQLLPTV